MVTYGSLFTGAGFMDYGVEQAFQDADIPLRCEFQVEIDPFCHEVLNKHWPTVTKYTDVKEVRNLPRVDLLIGGFPCQDVSVAGRGAGLAGERSGLWYEYARIVEETRPSAVIVENVPGLIRRGLDRVVGDLCDLGYAVEGTRIRAEDLGAPHRRERVFIVAYTSGSRLEEWSVKSPRNEQSPAERSGASSFIAVPDAVGEHVRVEPGWVSWQDGAGPAVPRDSVQTTKPGLGGVSHGHARWLDGYRWPAPPGPQYDWEPSRTKEVVPNRPPRLKACGNGVVPQCAYVAAARVIERVWTV